jgi:uridylate kinase
VAVVLKLGGSIVAPNGLDKERLGGLADAINASKQQLAVVVGSGSLSRNYSAAMRSLGASEFDADCAGIMISRANAIALAALLERGIYVEGYAGAKAALPEKTPVMGGVLPLLTTTSVAALLAECVRAERLVIATNVDGVYDKDPRKHADARRYGTIGAAQLVAMAAERDARSATENFVVDLLAAKTIARSRIPAIVLDGKDLKNLSLAIAGRKCDGTLVR